MSADIGPTATTVDLLDHPAKLIQIARCSADLTGDGNTDGADLGLLLGAWGACP